MIKYRVIYEVEIPNDAADMFEEDPISYSVENYWYPDLVEVERIG